jgi:hypothetical protein
LRFAKTFRPPIAKFAAGENYYCAGLLLGCQAFDLTNGIISKLF